MNRHEKPPRSASASSRSLAISAAILSESTDKPILLSMSQRFAAQWADLRSEIAQGSLPLVDLRSEKEFALGHIPGARNVPLLDNAERHLVGLTYKTVGREEAVGLGLEMFASKVEAFLARTAALCGPDGRIAIYCWRGGMRSQMVAALLSVHGLHPLVLEKGYKGFRHFVGLQLDAMAEHSKLVLAGRTGVGKTEVITKLKKEGLPVLDFEGLARHRGSAFGGLAQQQASPTQQNFENALVTDYLTMSGRQIILVEIENFIGPIRLPKSLRESVASSAMVYLERDFDDRVELLTRIYAAEWTADSETEFCEKFVLLQRFFSTEQYANIIAGIRRRDFREVIAQLLRMRYDGSYDKSLARHEARVIARFNMTHEETDALSFLRSALLREEKDGANVAQVIHPTFDLQIN